MNPEERNRVITRSVVVSLIGIITVIALYEIFEVLLTLYISALLAIGISPLVRRIERSRMVAGRRYVPRWLAILSIYVGIMLTFGIILALVIPPLVTQTQQLIQNMPEYSAKFQGWLMERGWIHQQYSWSDLFSTGAPGVAISGILGWVESAVGIMGTLLTVALLPFYLHLESASMHAALLRMVKPKNRSRVDRILRAVTERVAAWLGGQMLLAGIIGGSATVGFWLMGVPYFYVLGLVAAVGELIPVVGPILACVPAVVLGWTVSVQVALWVIIYTTVQQTIENNFLVPRIMERQVGVSAVTIIVAMLVGTVLFGIVGAILSVPTAGIIQIFIDEHFKHEAEEHFRREAEAHDAASS